MDNVSVHKVDGVEEAIEARGAIPFYLPAYSPDLNPIEQLFAKLKALLRKVAAYTLKNATSRLPLALIPARTAPHTNPFGIGPIVKPASPVMLLLYKADGGGNVGVIRLVTKWLGDIMPNEIIPESLP